MSSAIQVLESLLVGDVTSQKEHVIESASPRISNVDERMGNTFDSMVNEISAIWGQPQFNSHVNAGLADKHNSVVPPWTKGTPKQGGEIKTVKLSYWKRPDSTCYIAYRVELDKSKEPPKPLSYELILGAKKRNTESIRGVSHLRSAEKNWKDDLRANATELVKWLSGR